MRYMQNMDFFISTALSERAARAVTARAPGAAGPAPGPDWQSPADPAGPAWARTGP